MLCSSCNEESGDYGPIIDLDSVLQDYAWRELKRDARWYQGPLLRRTYYDIEIPWNFYEFEHRTTKFSTRNPQGSTLRQDFREKKQVELFTTDYKNNTAKEQIYNLKTQRQTQARTHISFQRGFVIKNNANFKLKIPDHYGHCGVTATADGHLRVSKREENLQELFTWQCDSDITVDPYHITKVTLMVTEDEFMADFEVRSRLRMPTGEAPIILKRKRDNHIHAVMLLSDLRDVFADLNHPNITVTKEKIGSNTETTVEFITTGTIESVRWSDQRVCIESKPIDPSVFSDSLYDSAICSNDVYSRVIKHATKNSFEKEQNTILSSTAATTPNEKKHDFQGFKVETKDMRFSIIPKIVTDNPEDLLDKESKLEESSQVRSVFPTIRLQEKERRMSDPEGNRPPPPYRSVSDLPLKVIRETSLEDKEKSEVGTPDSSDSQKFSKVTSV